MKAGMRSFANLNAAVDCAVIDDDLFLLIKDTMSNKILQQFLLDEYFPITKNNFRSSASEQQKLFDDIEGKILNEPALEYQKEIKKLLSENNDEEIYIRGILFKREIPKIYNNTCCISGMKIDATINISMIDACHIIPFSESYNDTVTNGISLCPNLHRAFDRGLIAIDNNYQIIVSSGFKEIESNYLIHIFEGKRINLPKDNRHFPSTENLEWHRLNRFIC